MGKDFTQKDMEGALFKNEKKESDKHPDYTGSVTIKGDKFNLAAWITVSKTSGKKYMNLKLTPWGQKSTKQPAQASGGQSGQDEPFVDDEIPFITNAGIR